jgi:SAM-dependent methyltransferase
MNCRNCKNILKYKLVNLNSSPLANDYLKKNNLNREETYYPLNVLVCNKCWLVQTNDFVLPKKIFNKDYAYFSSISKSYLDHAKKFSEKIIKLLKLNKNSRVIEIACNDGYLLKNFKKNNIKCIGIEPSISVAKAAKKVGIKVITKFFSNYLSKKISKKGKADLIIANNVYAHVPNINDFTLGLKKLLKPNGTIVLEFQYLISLMKYCQFDTIYHEHFSYFSLTAVNNIIKKFNLKIYDVEKINTHGGSLRVYISHKNNSIKITNSLKKLLKEESRYVKKIKFYSNFKDKVKKIKNNLLNYLIKLNNNNKTVCAYGAAAKGNTLLNFAGVKSDLIKYVFDNASSKQGKFMPGSHIPILDPRNIPIIKPDYILILPWNIKEEIVKQLKLFKVKFFIAIPKIKVL